MHSSTASFASGDIILSVSLYYFVFFLMAIQIGPSWLNPTEDEVWPLEETIEVAGLAFQGLEAYTEGNSSDHGELLWGKFTCAIMCSMN